MKQVLQALGVAAAIFAAIAAGIYGWQQLRWTFASPLELAFYEQDLTDKFTVSFSHAEVRKFISLDLVAAGELGSKSGFDCKALTIARAQAVCYRDILDGLCKQLWRVQLIYGKDNKIARATASIRKTCFW